LSTNPQAALRHLVENPAFPRSAAYDPRWVAENMMGPNVLWLAESLSQVLEFRPEHRILDLGCGRALSSIFLATEFGAQVWAVDLWIKPWDNWKRVVDAGLEDRVFPIYAEAHQLPFAIEFFDLVVSLDAYHYFGTDAEYIGYITRFVKPGGRMGIVVPATTAELEEVPPHLALHWSWEFADGTRRSTPTNTTNSACARGAGRTASIGSRCSPAAWPGSPPTVDGC